MEGFGGPSRHGKCQQELLAEVRPFLQIYIFNVVLVVAILVKGPGSRRHDNSLPDIDAARSLHWSALGPSLPQSSPLSPLEEMWCCGFRCLFCVFVVFGAPFCDACLGAVGCVAFPRLSRVVFLWVVLCAPLCNPHMASIVFVLSAAYRAGA